MSLISIGIIVKKKIVVSSINYLVT